jgi:hypothetical protein
VVWEKKWDVRTGTSRFNRNPLRGATGRGSVLFGGSNRLQVKVSIYRTMRALSLMVLPQVLLQSLIVAIPATRSNLQTVHSYQDDGFQIGRMQCQPAIGHGQAWQLTLSIIFTCIPYCLAWLLNVRPKSELERLPEMVDERIDLRKIFWVFVRVVITCGPMIAMSLAPAAYAYDAICTVLSLPLSIC